MHGRRNISLLRMSERMSALQERLLTFEVGGMMHTNKDSSVLAASWASLLIGVIGTVAAILTGFARIAKSRCGRPSLFPLE